MIGTRCRSVLLRRQADGVLPAFPVWDDVRTFDGREWAGHIDVISAGFPCQDISSAGAGAGIDGERSGLWREVVRIAGEVRPRFLWLENSPLLVGRGLARVLGDIAGLGMHARWGTLGADDVGAPHIRKRMWVVAYADEDGREWADLPLQPRRQDEGRALAGWGCEVAADACGACRRIEQAYAQPRLFEDAKVGAGDTAVQGDMLLPANALPPAGRTDTGRTEESPRGDCQGGWTCCITLEYANRARYGLQKTHSSRAQK
jgi:site-specific DNA-cytosine methylase